MIPASPLHLPVGTGGGPACSPERRATPAPARPVRSSLRSGTPVAARRPSGGPSGPGDPGTSGEGTGRADQKEPSCASTSRGPCTCCTSWSRSATPPIRTPWPSTTLGAGGRRPDLGPDRRRRRRDRPGRPGQGYRLCGGGHLARRPVAGAAAQEPQVRAALLPHLPPSQAPPAVSRPAPPGRTDPHRSVLPSPRSCWRLAYPRGSGGATTPSGGNGRSGATQKNATSSLSVTARLSTPDHRPARPPARPATARVLPSTRSAAAGGADDRRQQRQHHQQHQQPDRQRQHRITQHPRTSSHHRHRAAWPGECPAPSGLEQPRVGDRRPRCARARGGPCTPRPARRSCRPGGCHPGPSGVKGAAVLASLRSSRPCGSACGAP